MDQEKIAEKIKELRQKNNLTQKELATKLGVTYQAVSKWENAVNIPDFQTLTILCDYFKVDINYFLGEDKRKHKINKKYLAIGINIGIIIIILVAFYLKWHLNFEFKTMKSLCNDFDVSGSAAYNNDKTSLYISSIDYCSDEDKNKYKNITCNLYEEYNDTKQLVTSCEKESNVTIKEYLDNLAINVDNYANICKDLTSSNIYLEIEASLYNDKTIVYTIPITLEDNCD